MSQSEVAVETDMERKEMSSMATVSLSVFDELSNTKRPSNSIRLHEMRVY